MARRDLTATIQKLTELVDLVDLTERLGIPFKRSGKTLRAQCQFHNDSDPSMVLYEGKGNERAHFHCFVCNATADAIKLTQANQGLSFVAAVEWLARAYGVNIPKAQRQTRAPAVQQSQKEQPAEGAGNDLAVGIYRDMNQANQLDAWLQIRHLSKAGVPEDALFFARKNTLTEAANDPFRGYAETREILGRLEDQHLLVQSRDVAAQERKEGTSAYLDLGRSYRDFFFDDRIVFPISDFSGNVVGFAGRKLDNSSKAPKYLFTPGLRKSELLYRAPQALINLKAGLKSDSQYATLFVCEGLLDVLRLESLGLAAVGLLGAQVSEHQLKLLFCFAKTVPKGKSLRLAIFLDRDKAGLKGAANFFTALFARDSAWEFSPTFIWPTRGSQTNATEQPKDPDEFLAQCQDQLDAETILGPSSWPPALALLADELGVTPDEVLDDETWANISLSRRFQASRSLSKIVDGAIERMLDSAGAVSHVSSTWETDLRNFTRPTMREDSADWRKPPLTVNDDEARLNLARELAESGVRRGELPTDVAAWRRLDIAATAFNEGFKARLAQKRFRDFEPYDAVLVSRGFGKSEARLKTMACPEELVVQQYLVNELLTERFDDNSKVPFSHHIPAVRYDGRTRCTRTTGEDGPSAIDETLSFAYQIDMDVLEGRQPSGEAGMFRPYFDCWRDFVVSITRQSARMPQVHMIRLDVKRYYDRLRKSVVRNSLRRPIEGACTSLEDSSEFAKWFRPFEGGEKPQALLDWLLEQSFGFKYYDPETGSIKKAESDEQGIPQGPVLSAWLGTIALFPLDRALRTLLAKINQGDEVRAGYARYVDDIVLLADSEDVLGQLRAVAQDVARSLQVELVAKEVMPPMRAHEFAQHLTEGRALAVSGPIGEMTLLPAGDGDLGWRTLTTEPPKRYAALHLLRDQGLYFAPRQRVLDQISTALHAADLRPSEIGKASRWLWYLAAREAQNESTAIEIFRLYWNNWSIVCQDVFWTLDPANCSWDDPALYALEGVEKIFESANWEGTFLNAEENADRIRVISRLGIIASKTEFIETFINVATRDAPAFWGLGAAKLSRMFWQRALGMRWKAAQLAGAHGVLEFLPARKSISNLPNQTQATLRRAFLTDAETCRHMPETRAQRGRDNSPTNHVHDAMLWLHAAFVSLGENRLKDLTKPQTDPLLGISSELDDVISDASSNAEFDSAQTLTFLGLLANLRSRDCNAQTGTEEVRISIEATRRIALTAFVAMCPRGEILPLLLKRDHLLPFSARDGDHLVLPPLPGIEAQGIVSVTYSQVQDSNIPLGELSEVQWFTIESTSSNENEESTLPCPPVLMHAKASDRSYALPLRWNNPQTTSPSQIKLTVAPWETEWPKFILLSPPSLSPSAFQLAWAADIYESLARLNYQAKLDNSGLEYVAAWPYLVTENWPTQNDQQKSSALVLACYPTQTEKVSGHAFIRDGSRGLKTYDIPKENGHFWRAGVALTDIMGFSDELDKYSPLQIPEDDVSELYPPDRHLLRITLQKLRGHFSRGEYLPSKTDSPHIPATLDRSLRLLRRFPTNGDFVTGIKYVLSVDMETRAMGWRLKTQPDLNLPGILASFLERVASDVCKRIPLAWSKHLPAIPVEESLFTMRAATRTWWQIHERLNSSSGISESGWKALIYGLRVATLASWLRAMTFELQILQEEGTWHRPKDFDINAEWLIENPTLCNDELSCSFERLVQRFQDAIGEGRAQQGFEFITPLGWLALAASPAYLPYQVGEAMPALDISMLAQYLAARTAIPIDSEGTRNSEWPFEHVPEAMPAGDLPMHGMPDFIGVLEMLDARYGLSISEVTGDWKFSPKERQFTDTANQNWAFNAWQISFTDGIEPEQIVEGPRILCAWTETRSKSDRLLAVSARSKRMGKLLGPTQSVLRLPISPIATSIHRNVHSHGDRTSEEERKDPDVLAQANSAVPRPISAPSNASSGSFEGTAILKRWRDLQADSWHARRDKNAAHVRVAIMQWRVDDSYRHPIFDVEKPKYALDKFPNEVENEKLKKARIIANERNFENLWRATEMLPSWIEFRRQRLLDEALRACAQFSVDMLVLPEYSVRPDTVNWLRNRLKERNSTTSVIAGTYRLFGNSSELGFLKVHKDIFGLTDFGYLAPNTTRSAHPSANQNYGERSAILTLLTPIKYKEKLTVSAFSRRKKYPSNAAEEIINPQTSEWEPLFSISKLIKELEQRDENGGRLRSPVPLSASELTPLITNPRHVHYFAELICSELFLPMSPINYAGLASEYQKLVIRFGGLKGSGQAEDEVLDDVKALSRHLGTSPASTDLCRRSILVVPAMSGRSADYWCFGQSAILAGGVTTVFCNAVAGKQGIGGSCFIGRKSWDFQSPMIGIQPHSTPYSGWSRGIYYNSRDDALGECEQALVIADIDPNNMNEGRPRQQALPIPLQLVAHLPIVESFYEHSNVTMPKDREAKSTYTSASSPEGKHLCAGASRKDQPTLLTDTDLHRLTVLEQAIRDQMIYERVLNPASNSLAKLGEHLCCLMADGEKPFSKRLEHWRKHWRDLPQAGIPPALVDWLWVDLTAKGGEKLPEIFVPPWTDNDDNPIGESR